MSDSQIPAIASVPPRPSARSATGTRSPAGANRIAPSSGSGGSSAESPGRVSAEIQGQPPIALAARQHVHAQPLVQRDLGGEVRAAAESVDPEAAARRHGRAFQRPVPDDARAQQRRGVLVVDGLGQPVDKRLVGDARVRVAAVDVPAGEPRCHAQVLGAATAEPARPVRAAEPRHADPVTGREPARRRSRRHRRCPPPRGRAPPPAGAAASRPPPGAGRCGTPRSTGRQPGPDRGRAPAAARSTCRSGPPSIGPQESTIQART